MVKGQDLNLEGALARLRLGFDLVLSDVQMPGMDGFELVRTIRKKYPSLDLPIMGRICAVADVFDAITTRRPYKESLSNETAVDILQEKQGTHLDPELVTIFLNNLDEFVAIQQRFKDE